MEIYRMPGRHAELPVFKVTPHLITAIDAEFEYVTESFRIPASDLNPATTTLTPELHMKLCLSVIRLVVGDM